MPANATWEEIVASSLDWEQAHAKLDNSVKGLDPALRGRRPAGLPYSAWEILEHIRRTQHDLLDFCVNPAYAEKLKWPDDYWPGNPEPPNARAWDGTIAAIKDDRAALMRFTTEPGRDLTAKIPHGTGQTYLRTILVALDHCSYHTGQILIMRRLLGAWPAT